MNFSINQAIKLEISNKELNIGSQIITTKIRSITQKGNYYELVVNPFSIISDEEIAKVSVIEVNKGKVLIGLKIKENNHWFYSSITATILG